MIRSAIEAAKVSRKVRERAQSVADGEFMTEFMKVVCCVIRLAASVVINKARSQEYPTLDRLPFALIYSRSG